MECTGAFAGDRGISSWFRRISMAKHQFVKGEHLEHCPYQYLDYPKHFVGTTTFTFRSLFWWGHHMVCALLLEGPYLKRYKRKLFDRFHSVAGQGLEISLAPSFWEWKRGEGYTLPITHDRKAQMGAVMAERSSLKIARLFPWTNLGPCIPSSPHSDATRSLAAPGDHRLTRYYLSVPLQFRSTVRGYIPWNSTYHPWRCV